MIFGFTKYFSENLNDRVTLQQKKEDVPNSTHPRSSCGGRIRTCDLQVMSLASYQLLHSAIFLKRVQRYDFFSRYPNNCAFFL